jgi:transposase
VARVDLLTAQLTVLETELRTQLRDFPEASFLATIPGVGWVTVAGLLAQIGSIAKYRHGRQLIKLAGLNPARRESGTLAGRRDIGNSCGSDRRRMMPWRAPIDTTPRPLSRRDHLL